MHSDAGKPQRERCCDYLIDTKRRNPQQCDGLCPWQRCTLTSQEVIEFMLLCTVGVPGEHKTILRTISARRFEIALRAFVVPDSEIRAAWYLMGQCCQWVNSPGED